MTFSQEPTSFRLQNGGEIPNTDQGLLVAFLKARAFRHDSTPCSKTRASTSSSRPPSTMCSICLAAIVKGRPDNSAYIGCHLKSHEKQLGKFRPRVAETTSRNSTSAIQRAVERIRGLPGPIGKVGVEASFLPWDGANVLQDGLDNCQIVDAYFPLERLRARKTSAELTQLRSLRTCPRLDARRVQRV
jgi:hypothetical protein